MNGFLRSKPISALVALVMITSVIAIPLSSLSVHVHAQGTVTITEFPTAGYNTPLDITTGPDRNLWFAEAMSNIGRITPHSYHHRVSSSNS